MIAHFRYKDLKEAAVIAADAGPMQIEWSGGVACRCAGVVRRSTTADTMGRKVGYTTDAQAAEAVQAALIGVF